MLKTVLRRAQPKALLLTGIILAVTAASAAAATVTGPATGNWTLIGTTGNDTITGGGGNNWLIGLGGNDQLTVGGGNNIIEADGSCPPGYQDSITPFPGNGVYCSVDQITKKHTDTITAGGGNNVILGGGYSNNITAGGGANVIYGGGVSSNTITVGGGPNVIVAGPGTNTITAGNGNNVIYGGSPSGPNTIKVGNGTNLIFAQNGKVDHVTCGSTKSTVYADKNDVVTGCTKITSAAPNSMSTPPSFGSPHAAAMRRANAAKLRVAKHHIKHKKSNSNKRSHHAR